MGLVESSLSGVEMVPSERSSSNALSPRIAALEGERVRRRAENEGGVGRVIFRAGDRRGGVRGPAESVEPDMIT